MKYVRMAIERESPEELGYGNIRYNLSESSIRDRRLSDLKITLPDLLLFYGEHRGDPELRALVASQADNLKPSDVLITAGAAGALFIIATSLLSPEDHLVVVRPNYATNIETPRAIGCQISFIDLNFDCRFELDLEAVMTAIRPSTKLISITCPHNPTGTMISVDQLERLVKAAKDYHCHLLVDETYRDLSLGVPLPLAASLSPRVISVSSMSKAYGIPGIRTGWLITRDGELMNRFLAAKEQVGICGSVVDEWIAAEVLRQRHDFLSLLKVEMKRRLQIVRDWVCQDPLIEWVEPKGGVVCFPRVTPSTTFNPDAFYPRLLQKYGTYVGPGHWFEMPEEHFRVGYMWPTEDELKAGLNAISEALRESMQSATKN
jgi:aspartate/methionine/tyrosine aminotransferase